MSWFIVVFFKIYKSRVESNYHAFILGHMTRINIFVNIFKEKIVLFSFILTGLILFVFLISRASHVYR